MRIIILGPRQVGKATLIKQLIKDESKYLLINGDEPDAREQISNLSSDRLRVLVGDSRYLIIDEAQLIPDIGISLKRITDYLEGVRLIVSGSSALELANTVNEPLTGRKLEYQLFPLSFGEMCNYTSLLSEKAFIIFRLNALNRNLRNEIKKGKKIYFRDNGIRNAELQPVLWGLLFLANIQATGNQFH